MGTSSKKNIKWIILGCVVVVIALLVAFMPIIFSRYMRTKWETTDRFKVNALLMNVSGTLQQSSDKKQIYLKGDNGLFYVLEGVNDNLEDKIGKSCSVLGKFRKPEKEETVDGNTVRLFIGVNKIVFEDKSTYPSNINENNLDKNVSDIEEKSLKKLRLRVEVNSKLNKQVLFDVIKGKVEPKSRKDLNKENVVAYVLRDEFGDSYSLYKKDANLTDLAGKEIIVLGREILPPKNMPLVFDELSFEIYEVYDENYNKLM